ncbi:hypothetical protein CBLAS_0860 [Campylobacter blaseri]|uniref:Uncharacterized protein n=1 Tax=Campylobacter blaseri TaxID=2042961 RepID=A0A2P8R2N1_9BACT|nr:hypothetical protein [Campylobacter blaseri]PSM52740.1 hypothetical protein CQ405_03155 [Campylobacter blaseri]PSM54388.1 hypothetical protein CRN67_03155 [Campylobacter blaseri]QKF86045.1 hypothetical protein CBLAS_0860 [Campylobacter blaseri]
MGDKKHRKYINFDLKTEKILEHFSDTSNAYKKIKNFMINNGFEHNQKNGYISLNEMNTDEIHILAVNLNQKFDWFKFCVNKIIETNVDNEHSLENYFNNELKETLKSNIIEDFDFKDVDTSALDEVLKEARAELQADTTKQNDVSKNTNNTKYTEFDERTLPRYLKDDIEVWVNRKEEDKINWDLYWCQLYGNINSAQHGNEISVEFANYLREKYL